MQEVFYRDAKADDLSQIVSIYNSTIESRMVTADLEPVPVESKIPWFEEHTAHRRPLWVIESNAKEMMGWASFQDFYGRPAYDATAEISIYLHAKFRGQGLGKQILQYCMEKSSTLGIKTLLGFIFAHNQPSLNLFYKAGFTNWATLPDIAVLDGVERSLIIVGKRIS